MCNYHALMRTSFPVKKKRNNFSPRLRQNDFWCSLCSTSEKLKTAGYLRTCQKSMMMYELFHKNSEQLKLVNHFIKNVPSLRDHSFSMYAKFYEKVTFRISVTYVSGGKKCKFFGTFCVRTK